jgi:hypothetical protein
MKLSSRVPESILDALEVDRELLDKKAKELGNSLDVNQKTEEILKCFHTFDKNELIVMFMDAASNAAFLYEKLDSLDNYLQHQIDLMDKHNQGDSFL